MSYKGLNAQTGRAIYDIDHLRQSVKDVLLTPTVSRLMRREYGSQLFNLIDQAANPATHLRLYAAIAIALLRWEPRLQLSRIQISQQSNGQSIVDIEGFQLVNNQRRAVSLKAPISGELA
ncbi:MAG: GPW/gp25 family protein [Agitococcus sp.]|nr:GPW/gp25 family protein [Agitococcus sp.]